jgi:hypothetical protein
MYAIVQLIYHRSTQQTKMIIAVHIDARSSTTRVVGSSTPPTLVVAPPPPPLVVAPLLVATSQAGHSRFLSSLQDINLRRISPLSCVGIHGGRVFLV